MQRTIMSFFHPKKEGKAKKPEETASSTRETEPPPKVALKERNRVPESDSPVKRSGRRTSRVLCSEGEEEDEAFTTPKGQKPVPTSPQVSPPGPVPVPQSSHSLSSTSAACVSPPGIPKRLTARKQLSKRTIQDALEEPSKDKGQETERRKEGEGEEESSKDKGQETKRRKEGEGEEEPSKDKGQETKRRKEGEGEEEPSKVKSQETKRRKEGEGEEEPSKDKSQETKRRKEGEEPSKDKGQETKRRKEGEGEEEPSKDKGQETKRRKEGEGEEEPSKVKSQETKRRKEREGEEEPSKVKGQETKRRKEGEGEEEPSKVKSQETKRRKEREGEEEPSKDKSQETKRRKEGEGEEEPSKDKSQETKRKEGAEAEPPTESGSEPEVAVKQEPRDEDQAKPPPRPPKMLSSFFAPRKPAIKKEVKEEVSGTPVKEAPKGLSPSDVSSSPLDPSSYNPAKKNYHPVQDACWTQGQKVPYLAVARTFEKIEEVSARLRMVETLSNLLRSVVALSPPDLLPILYLSLNCLGPPQQGLELGVGDGVLLKAVAQATGRQLDSVRAEAAEMGDVGLVAEYSRSTQRLMLPPHPLTASGVIAKFRDIARLTGSASTARKMDIIKGLFVACRHSEARFIARALSGRLRLGLAEQSVLAALAQAVSLTPPGQEFPPAVVDAGKSKTAEARKAWLEEQSMILKQTFCEVPDLDRIVPALLQHGLERLPEHCRLSPGVPLKPMLAHPTRGVSEVLKRFDEAAFTCEYKYDGQRAQIHVLEGGEVKIFSRNQEDNTGKYPDIISRVPRMKLPSVTSFILDTEAVAWDREKKQIQPFQVLTTRKRKDVDAAEIQVQVCLYAFDLIYLNGELLRENFVETEGEFVFATSLDTKDMDQIAEFLEQSVRDSCEGLMVKTLDVDATYEIAKRSHNWLKLKKDYLDGVGDTLDLVVIGAYLGRGKRAGRYGGFLLAAYDEESEEFQAICKLGTGFSDEELEEYHQSLQALVQPTPRPYVRADSAVAPDHWLEPSTVWEVRCADLSLSPIYPAARGLVDREKGISLRFPRFVRVREDKTAEEATSSAQVAWLYRKQSQIQNQEDTELDSDLEDFY